MLSSADGAKGLCPLDSRSSPERRPPQTAPDPEMRTHLLFRPRAGRGLGAEAIDDALLTGPPERLRAGRFSAQKRGGASCFILGFMV